MTPNPNAERDRATWRAFREPSEGGYQALPDDHGNYYRGQLIGTCHGVTPWVLAMWRRRPVTARDMRDLSWDEADQISDAYWWRPGGANYLPSGVNLMVVDFGWGSSFGCLPAVRMLQEAVGFAGANVDGIVGPHTLLACLGAGPGLIDKLHDRQAEFYASLGSRFLRGWEDRDDRRRALALRLVATSAGSTLPTGD